MGSGEREEWTEERQGKIVLKGQGKETNKGKMKMDGERGVCYSTSIYIVHGYIDL